MPQIIVTADGGAAFAVTLKERVNVADFESQHFATQLVERIGWAVADADRAERTDARAERADVDADTDRAGQAVADADRAQRTDARAERTDADPAEQLDNERVTAPSPA